MRGQDAGSCGSRLMATGEAAPVLLEILRRAEQNREILDGWQPRCATQQPWNHLAPGLLAM